MCAVLCSVMLVMCVLYCEVFMLMMCVLYCEVFMLVMCVCCIVKCYVGDVCAVL